MKFSLEETIAALATPPGQGAIGVIRISGPRAIEIADGVFFGKNLTKVGGHTVQYGKIRTEDGHILDECMATVFRAPRSYTKEDSVEFSCHGSPYILQEILRLLVRKGARPAKAGEFTMRAFLNGQMDLTQAEAVADLIASDSKVSHELAMNQMRGGITHEIKGLRDKLIEFASLIELELDFGEEDVEFADRSQLKNLVAEIGRVVSGLIESFRLGNAVKEGVATVIAGRPNAGKSTLLNALLKEDRAIVSEIPGTTRDTIEESLTIDGITFRLIDTAGIRNTKDLVEKKGVERTMDQITRSSIVLYLFDVTSCTPEQLWSDLKLFREGSKSLTGDSRFLFIANKMDLYPTFQPAFYYKEGVITSQNLITVSAKNVMNMELLKERIVDLILSHGQGLERTVVTNIRHYDALVRANNPLERIMDGLESGLSGDLIAIDIRQALYQLGTITGEVSTDDLLDSIFLNFCIGK